MSQNKTSENKKSFSVDWLLRGSLTKIGDIFDRVTGRGWKPSSSLATSELIEKLKTLLDKEAKDLGNKGIFVPHNLKLKIQWDKFSLDSESATQKLEHELLTAIIDHINDKRYHTYAPLKLQIKPDYFTEGVRLLAGFDKFVEDSGEAAINVTVPNLKNIVIPPAPEVKIEKQKEIVTAEFTLNNKPKRIELGFAEGERLNVGRTKENSLTIEDGSISKIHATLFINSQKQLMVADTGSTNGTFVGGKRIAYGKAFAVENGDKVKFGTVEVSLEYVPKQVPAETISVETTPTESSIATERLITEDGYSEQLEQTAVIKKDKPLPETAFVVKPLVDKKPAETMVPKPAAALQPLIEKLPEEKPAVEKIGNGTANFSTEDAQTDENPNPTEPGIILDFGENK